MAITLPTSKIAAETQDPRNLIIYGLPKVGKTTLLAQLEDNLILDFENGSKYVEALKVKINTFAELSDVCSQIKQAGKPYKFITIDTITALEDFVKPLALQMYKSSPAGANFNGDITTAPMGAGFGYIRLALEKVIGMISQCADNIILVGHVKDKSIVSNTGQEVGNIKDFDLTGKAGRIIAAKSDGIGYAFRDQDSNLCINFAAGVDISAGARPAHLANKTIIVAERQEDGTFISHWDRIYPSLKK